MFLDVDGTLAPIATTPQAAHVEPALLPLLERLQRLCAGALALVSGRCLVDIDTLFSPLTLPAAGVHGLERRRADGVVVAIDTPKDALDAIRPVLAAFAAARSGLLLEDKGKSLALHYRLAPRYGAAVYRLASHLAAQTAQLRLINGRKVVEFVPHSADKGRAIAAFLGESPFAGRRPIFAGDDTTDEDGFKAVNQMGGLSIKVAADERRARSPSAARYRVRSVAALHLWLGAVAARLEAARCADNANCDDESGTAAFHRVLS